MFFVLLAIHVFTAHAWLYVCGQRRLALSAAFGTVLMAVVPAQIARVTHDMQLAAILSGVLMLVLLAAAWRRGPRTPPPVAPEPIGWGWRIVALAALGLVAWTAIQGHYFDEDWMHHAASSAMGRGVAPVEHPLYPGEPFPYHYAFNSLSGQLVANGWRVEYAHDVVRILSFVLLLGASVHVGREVGGRRGAGLALVLVPLASSPVAYLLWRGMGQLELHWSLLPNAWMHNGVPIVIVSFFQPPMGLGMAIGLATLLLLVGPFDARRWLAGALMLGLLSTVHVLFFGLVGLGVGAGTLVAVLRRRAPAWSFFALAAALGLAVLLGGFFAVSQPGQMLVPGRYFADAFVPNVMRHLVTFGLPLLALPYWFVRTVQHRRTLDIALLVATVFCLIVPNVVVYPKSWDVVKFYMIAGLFLNVMFAGALARIRLGVAIPLVMISCVSSSVWLARTTFLDGKYGIHRWREGVPSDIARAVVEELGGHLAPYDGVLVSSNELSKVGVLTPGFDPAKNGGAAYPIDHERARRLADHRKSALLHLRAADLEALDVAWIVLSPQDERRLSPEGRAALAERFESYAVVQRASQRRTIYRVRR